jgi:methylmalonyl-CoA mutase N-terminal domain/subunit
MSQKFNASIQAAQNQVQQMLDSANQFAASIKPLAAQETASALQNANPDLTKEGLRNIQNAAILNKNMFEVLMETCKQASLGQITEALFEVGGQYRRNM